MRHLRTPSGGTILIPEDAVNEFVEKYGSSIPASRKKRRASYTLRRKS
jgi:hypothetical protein